MGQSLTITITTDKEEWCAIYYHWSGYTVSALEETKEIINCIYNGQHETKEKMLLRLVHFIEDNGGCIRGTMGEHSYIQELYPNETFKEEGNRSDGIIALSQDGIIALKSWATSEVYIQVDDDMVDFCAYSGYENLEKYLEDRKSWDDEFDEEEFKNIPKLDCCLGYFGVDEIDDVINQLDGIDAYIVQCGDEICELID